MHAPLRRGRLPRTIGGIGVDTWGVDFGLLADDGRLLGNPICYRDSFAEGADRKVARRIGLERFYGLIGHMPAQVSTLSQLVALKNSPGACRLKFTSTFLMMPDLFRYFLCGHSGAELTALGSSQLADVRRATWSRTLFRELGLPLRILPPIVKPATVVGCLRADLAARTGLNRAPVVAVAGHDTASAAAAVPEIGDDCAFISSGTWSVLGEIRDRPITDPAAGRCGFINEFGLESVLFVKNLMGLYLFENLYRSLKRQGRRVTYASMVQEASRAKPFACFLDTNSPMLFVTEDPEGPIREFLRKTGQRPPRTTGGIVRAILEGLAWSYRAAIRDLEALTGHRKERLFIVGGGIRNRLLCQMTADAAALEITTGAAEATAAGNVGMQALATGLLKSAEQVRKLILNSFVSQVYRPRDTQKWDKNAHRYKEILKRQGIM